jgi:predicted transcriptional regulator
LEVGDWRLEEEGERKSPKVKTRTRKTGEARHPIGTHRYPPAAETKGCGTRTRLGRPALQCGVMRRIITYYWSRIMSALKTISFRIPSDTVESLDELAESMDRDRSHVLNEAVENYLRLNEHHIKLIQKGLRAAERGDFVPDAEMKKLIIQMRRAK